MASTIGGYSFITLKGTIEPVGDIVETWRRKGTDGFGMWTVGSQAEEHDLYPVRDFASSNTRNSAISAYKALQGTVQTVTDDVGNVAKCAILRVRHLQSVNYPQAVGGVVNGRFLLRMHFVVQMKT